MKKALAWTMLVASLTGDALSWAGVIGEGEPKLVLHLSWFALIFAALDGILIESKGST